MAKLKPVNRQIYCRRATTGEKRMASDGREAYFLGDIVLTDIRGDFSHYYEILDVAEDCRLFGREDIGKFVRLPVWHPRLIREVVPGRTRMVREQAFEQGVAPACLLSDF